MKKNTYYKWLAVLLCIMIIWPQVFKSGITTADAASTGTVTATSLNIRTGPATTYERVQVNGNYTSLKKGDKVTIVSEKSGWYKISFSVNGKKTEGYVMADYIKKASVTPTPTAKPTVKPTATPTVNPKPTSSANSSQADFNVPGTVNATSLNVRKTPATTGTRLGALKNKQKVTILNEVFAGGQKWYRISFTLNKKTQTGYVLSDYIKLTISSHIMGYVNSTASMKVQTVAGSKSAYVKTKAGKVISLPNKRAVKITKEVTDNKGVKWFGVSFTISGVKYNGYLPANKVLIKKVAVTKTPTKAPTVTVTPSITPSTTPKASPTPTVSLAPSATPTATVQATPTVTPAGYVREVNQNTEATIQYASKINVYSEVVNSSAILIDTSYNPILLSMDEKVIVSKTVRSNPDAWYYVTFKKGSNTISGYVQAQYVVFGTGGFEDTTTVAVLPTTSVTPVPTGSVTASPTPIGNMNDAQFEAYLTSQAFPESYKPYLRSLHRQYPAWIFEAYQTGLDWNTVIAKQNVLGKNLISNGKSIEWKALDTGAYSWTTDSFIPFDGSTWVTASKEALEYYIDPRNFLTEKSIFQFEMLTYKAQYQNGTGVESILYNTPLYNKSFTYKDDTGKSTTTSYSQTFVDAAAYSGVSPYHLATRVKQEVVTGTSTLSSSVSGTVAGLEGLYNFYNIGAYHSTAAGGAIANALKYAKNGTTSADLNTLYRIPWDNPYDSIVGGAYIIGSNYIKRGQDTIYTQKFNVTPVSTHTHQYMANIEAPNAEGAKTYAAYTGMTNVPIVFSIPVYSNMPAVPAPLPVKKYNPNNWLKTLTIDGYSLTPTFDLSKEQFYSLIVENAVSSINLKATAVSAKATVSGTGTIPLQVGNNTVTIVVTAENGDVRQYQINVVREN